ncbi:mechanosensitive ion channel family protein [Oscillatoria sp. CS-180]|uniref:mechanosensitive ion channel family protein n=1 Tax=Oscillatoria sp. CS-180 TaxID=3021720 RepID=UPI00232C547E|nr:mechanosensitive ion channel family protein [Oscillatoria sp. CS-180]MDB9525063.1 mechanosensitive ion channel family protein [Oscillatoria sp. CS-180]
MKLTLGIRWQRLSRRYCGYCACGFAIALLCFTIYNGYAFAQDEPTATEEGTPVQEDVQDDGNTFENPVTRPFQNLAPPEIRAIFEETNSEVDLASLFLDGRFLFQIAAPAENGSQSASARAREIERNLESVARSLTRSGSLELEISSTTDDESNQPVIEVNDEMVMTVTYLDARLTGANTLTLRAAQITDVIETALRRYYQERQPDFLWRQVQWTMAILLLTLLGSFAIEHFHQNVNKRRQQLRESRNHPVLGPIGLAERAVMNTFRATLLTRQRINSLGVIKQSLKLLQIILWIVSALVIVGLFPYTRWLQLVFISYMRVPFRFVVIALVTYSLIRLSSIWIDRLFLTVQSQTAAAERSQRLVLRLSTFSQVVEGVVAFVIIVIACLVMLSLSGIEVAPLIAGAGLLGFAISFASQSLIKDIINGFLVLIEDQYGVGDVVTVRDMTGFVEAMNLRITQLRATDGKLITIPNGQIDIVQNLSKEWSQVDLAVPVGLEADIDQALQLVEKTANDLRKDEIWGTLILEPPVLLGVDELSHTGATIRIWIKTQPLKQWDVAREYRRRLKTTFERAQIPLGVPQQVIHVSGLSEQIAKPPESSVNGLSSESSDTTVEA